MSDECAVDQNSSRMRAPCRWEGRQSLGHGRLVDVRLSILFMMKRRKGAVYRLLSSRQQNGLVALCRRC